MFVKQLFMKKVLFCVQLFLLLSFAAEAQKTPAKRLSVATPGSVGVSSERLQRLDTMLNGWVNQGRTNGAVALLLRDGKIVYHKAFGFDDEEKKLPMRTDHIFRIASQTKAITSVAVM